MHLRHSTASGDFGSWASTIGERLPEGLKGEIMQARTDINKLADLAEIFAKIRQWIGRVGDVEGPVSVPLLNVAATVRKLAV